jgi:DNA-directed RNA polymerase specialized sigma24 family protein
MPMISQTPVSAIGPRVSAWRQSAKACSESFEDEEEEEPIPAGDEENEDSSSSSMHQSSEVLDPEQKQRQLLQQLEDLVQQDR